MFPDSERVLRLGKLTLETGSFAFLELLKNHLYLELLTCRKKMCRGLFSGADASAGTVGHIWNVPPSP